MTRTGHPSPVGWYKQPAQAKSQRSGVSLSWLVCNAIPVLSFNYVPEGWCGQRRLGTAELRSSGGLGIKGTGKRY